MRIANNAKIDNLNIVMREALIGSEETYKEFGRKEGVTITCGTDKVHSAGTVHYYGLAIDERTYFWRKSTQKKVVNRLKEKLNKNFVVILEKNHIHIQYRFWRKILERELNA